MVVGHPAHDAVTWRVEVSRLWFPLRRLFPGAGQKARAVPVPDARVRAAVKKAARVARTVDGCRLPNVRANRNQGRNKVGGLVQHELPVARGEAEDRPILDWPAGRCADRDRHRVTARARERAAEHLPDRVRQIEDVYGGAVLMYDLTRCCL